MAVRTAKAVTEEVPEVAQSSIGRLATIPEKNSERDVQRLASRFKLTLPVPLSTFKVGRQTIHYIKMTDWAKFLLSQNLWHHLTGLDKPDAEKCEMSWSLFWKRYREYQPSHDIFQRPNFDFSRCCGLMLHGDEGRGLRKTAVLVLAAHSILGYGIRTSPQKRKEFLHKLNYTKSTWTTRFLLGILPKWLYCLDGGDDDEDEEPQAMDGDNLQSDVFECLLDAMSKDLANLFENGVVSPLDGQRYYFCIINVCGDWPFLQRAGHLGRTFYNAAKHSKATRVEPKGICHQCLADRHGILWEDFESRPPPWEDTRNLESPFISPPALLQRPHARNDHTELFAWDLFHSWHLGCGKPFLGTAIIVLATSSIFAGGVDKRLEDVTQNFLTWCDQNRLKPHLRKLCKASLSWTTTANYPSGVWSKGHTTRVLNKWFLAVCAANARAVAGDELLTIAHQCAICIERFLKGLYSYEIWIPSRAASEIASYGLSFLRFYGLGASVSYGLLKRLFLLQPNFHRFHHIAWGLHVAAKDMEWVPNPLIWATQPEEDYIGRPSRISRRVSPRLTVLRTLQRSLIAARAAYRDAGLLPA